MSNGAETLTNTDVVVNKTRIYVGKSGINYTESSLLFFERKFFDDEFIESKGKWMREYWHTSIYYALVYVALIFIGQAYMARRARFDLRRPLIAWNFLLAGFSILGTIRVWPDFVSTVYTKGILHTMCSSDYAHGVTGTWSWYFIMSKLPELGDTFFIVFRKQPLIFLHWYHHATVLVYCWFSAIDFSASGRWFSLMNYTVHSVMYSYYAFRALRFKIPKWVNIAITSGQILQMVVGIYINCVAYYQKTTGGSCDVSDDNIKWSFIMYFTYFLLFFHFFYKAYVSKSSKPDAKSENGLLKKNGVHAAVDEASSKKTNGHHTHANGANGSTNGVHKNGSSINGVHNGTKNGEAKKQL